MYLLLLMLFTDGPELLPGPTTYYVLLDYPVSLVCGYNLDSNAPAIITWTDPQGKVVSNDDGMTMENGPEVVHLSITRASLNNNGTWKCSIHQKSDSADGKKNEITLIVVGKFVSSL